MEIIFKKYFWSVHLLFIFVVAFMLARTVNVFVEGALLPLPKAGGHAAAVPAEQTELRVPDIEALSRLTGLAIPKPDPIVVVDGHPAEDSGEPTKSGLRVKLLGTLLAGMKEWSLASILDTNTNRSQTFFLGDSIQGAKIIDIERNRVIINNNGRREFINGEAGDGASAPVAVAPPPTPAPGGPPNTGLGSGIRSTGENSYEVPRTEIDRTLANLNEVAMQARIVPAFKDGTAHGFKLFSIRPDSIYTKIGVQNGDVIRRINGFDLNSPEKALEVYAKLKEASRIEIEIDRNGTLMKKDYSIR